MEPRNTNGNQSQRPHATASLTRSVVAWAVYTLAIAVVIAIALVCVPWVVVWCLLFDAD